MALIRKLALALLLLAVPAVAQNIAPVHGDCSQGNTAVLTQGLQSTNRVMASYPACTVTVYDHGTTNLSTIYSDSSFTLLANPFTATALGNWIFYAAIGTSTPDRYDVVMSGGLNGGFPAPYTIADIYLWAGAGGGGGGLIPCGVPNDIQAFLNSTNLGCDTGIATLDPTTHTISDNILNANQEVDVSDPTTTGLVDLGHSNGTAVDAHFLFGPSPTFSTSGGGYGISPPDAAPTNVGYALTISSLTPVGGLLPTAWTTVAVGVTSIQMKNGGVSFGSPLTGAGSLNCVGCTWSGTTPDFTVTVPSGLSVAGSSGDAQGNNGSGALSALHLNDNGTTMTVTESVTPLVAAAKNLGTAPLPFGDGYFGGAANHSFHFDTSAVASNVAMAIPNHASNPVQGISDPSDTEAVNYISTDGVQHRISLAGLSVAGSSGDLQTNNGSSALGAAHINDNGTTMTVTESVTPKVAAADNLGTALLPFGDIFIGGTASKALDFNVSGLSTNRTVIWPNSAGTAMVGSSTSTTTTQVAHATATAGVYAPSAIANADLPAANFVSTFPAVATAQTFASIVPFNATFPIDFATPTAAVVCGTNPGGAVIFTITDVTTSTTLGTVSVSTSCVGTFATTGHATQAVSANDFYTVVSGTDATAANIVIDFRAVRN